MTIGWGKPINKLVNAVGVETKIEIEEPPPDVLDPGLPESLQKLTPEAKASLQKVVFGGLRVCGVVEPIALALRGVLDAFLLF